MIASFVLYGTAIGVFIAATARLLEIAVGGRGRARRHLWIAAILAVLAVPPLAMLLQEPVVAAPSHEIGSAPPEVVIPGRVAAFLQATPAPWSSMIAGRSFDELAAILWITATAAVLLYHLLNAWRLTRRARAWRPSTIDSQEIAVAHDLGPALYGWWRPRIVFPDWLLGAPATTQRLALAHEREHLAAHDPQILAAATLVAALLPWNVALWWMLRRLRFTMEVDCDARVLRGGADVSDYGLALLFVSERQASFPNATIALIERPSQLERRINIMVKTKRRPVLVAALCVALAGTCAFAAAQIEAPARIDTAPLKPPPTGGAALRVGQSVERLVQKEYPELLQGKFAGAPVIVVLMNDDFSIAKWAKIEKANDATPVGTADFAAIGIAEKDVPYAAITAMALPDQPGKLFQALFTERPAKRGERFVSKLFPDTREIDRAIFQRYFPDAAKNGMPSAEHLWVLLDRAGNVLRNGQEKLEPSDWNRTLEARFPGIKTQALTLTPVTNDAGEPLLQPDGKDLQLHCIWLAPESPLPKS